MLSEGFTNEGRGRERSGQFSQQATSLIAGQTDYVDRGNWFASHETNSRSSLSVLACWNTRTTLTYMSASEQGQKRHGRLDKTKTRQEKQSPCTSSSVDTNRVHACSRAVKQAFNRG